MRSPVDAAKVEAFMKEIGRLATGPGQIYLVGGSTMTLLGLRAQTVDVDIKLDPEPKGIFEAIAKLKNQLDLNIEIASPDHFIPTVPGWKERSQFIARYGSVDFFHFDFYSQALAKIERGHPRDLLDASSFLLEGLIDLEKLKRCFEDIWPGLVRYPAINAQDFQKRFNDFVQRNGA